MLFKMLRISLSRVWKVSIMLPCRNAATAYIKGNCMFLRKLSRRIPLQLTLARTMPITTSTRGILNSFKNFFSLNPASDVSSQEKTLAQEKEVAKLKKRAGENLLSNIRNVSNSEDKQAIIVRVKETPELLGHMDQKGMTPLMYAAQLGHIDLVNEFIVIGAPYLHYVDVELNDALFHAIKSEHVAIVAILSQHYSKRKHDMSEYLCVAAEQNNTEVYRFILHDNRLDFTHFYIKAIYHAIDNRNVFILEDLIHHLQALKKLASSEKRYELNFEMFRCLKYIVLHSDDVELAKIFIDAGAWVNGYVTYEDDDCALRKPILMLAIEKGRIEITKLLVAAGADPHAKDTCGQAAFDIAAKELRDILCPPLPTEVDTIDVRRTRSSDHFNDIASVNNKPRR